MSSRSRRDRRGTKDPNWNGAVCTEEGGHSVCGSHALTAREVGAGTGYWAHLLQQQGVDIVAADLPAWQERFNKQHRAVNGAQLMGEQRYTTLKAARRDGSVDDSPFSVELDV